MIIKFQIVKAVIVEAVKAATYVKGKVDEAAQPGSRVPYYETAGDDDTHGAILTHDFQTALEIVKTFFVDYITPTASTIGNNVIYSSNEDDIVTFTLNVSRRYNGTLTDTLARLTAKYIEDYMIYQWWLKTTNVKQAEPYFSTLASDEQSIRRCFILSAPSVPTYAFPSSLSLFTDGLSEGALTLSLGDEQSITYSIPEGTIDDIEALSSRPSIVEIHRGCSSRTFCVVPKNTGVCDITLYSKHNDDVYTNIEVTVTNEQPT